jgi:hypothetical protein
MYHIFFFIEPYIDGANTEGGSSLYFNIFKSLINFDIRDLKAANAMIIGENDQTVLSMIVNYIWNLIQNEKKQLFISIYGFQNRFEDCLASEEKKLQLTQQQQQKKKEKKNFFKAEITSLSQIYQILNKVRLSALNKKLPSAFVYNFIFKSANKKGKFIVWDILNLVEKSQTFDSKSYNNFSRLISTTFSLEKEWQVEIYFFDKKKSLIHTSYFMQNAGVLDPYIRVVKKNLIRNTNKLLFLCNFRIAEPFYQQNNQLMQYMRPIFESSKPFDSLFFTSTLEVSVLSH